MWFLLCQRTRQHPPQHQHPRQHPCIRATRIGALLAIVFVSLVLACSPAPQHPLRVATLPWPGYESLHLAQSLNDLDPREIRLVTLVNTSQISSALRNGSVAAGMVTLDSALTLMAEGVDLQVILVMDFSHGADAVVARSDITSLQDLRGKRVAVENAAVGGVMLDATLAAAGLVAEDIQLVSMTVNEHLAAYQRGEVDALVTFEPVRSELLELGARLLFDSREIPGRIVDVLVVREESMEIYTAELHSLVTSHFRALDHLQRQPQDSFKRLSPYLGLSPAAVEAQFGGIVIPSLADNYRLLAGDQPELQNTAGALAKLMYERELLPRPLSSVMIADARFLPELIP